MFPVFIAQQAIRLIKAFPKVAKAIGDLPPDTLAFEDIFADGMTEELTRCIYSLMKYNMLHVTRVETKEQPNNLKNTELEGLEKNFESFVDSLTVSDNDQRTELESVFISLYKILWAFEENPKKLAAFKNTNKMSTPLLFLQAAQLANRCEPTAHDDAFSARKYNNIHSAITYNSCTVREWNALTSGILDAIGLVTIVKPDTWDKERNVDESKNIVDSLIDLVLKNDLFRIQCMMTDSAKEICMENISDITYTAAKCNHFGIVVYLLDLYEVTVKKMNRKPEDLGTPEDEYSLLGLALHAGQLITVNKLIKLQNGPRFNAMDRHRTFALTDKAWNDETERQKYKSSVGRTLLHLAVAYKQPGLIQPLVEQAGINPDEKTYYSGMTALQLAEDSKNHSAAKILRGLTASPVTEQKHVQDATAGTAASNKRQKTKKT